MASTVPMSRSRGSLSGLALVLLGAWGGLAPFIGPYFKFGFEPDRALVYSTGRLYLSALPGGVVLLAGLVVLITRSRGFGGFCALLAALGGAWFVVGQAVLAVLAGNAQTYTVGSPIGTSLSVIELTELGSFAGVGVLIVFFAALSLGRLSIAAHKDHVRFGDLAGPAVAGAGLASVGLSASSSPFDSYQPPSFQQPSYQPDSYQPTTFQPAHDVQSPMTTTNPQPVVGGQSQFPSQYPSAQDPFGPGTVTYSPGQTKYPPTQEQTNPLTSPTEQQQFPPAQR